MANSHFTLWLGFANDDEVSIEIVIEISTVPKETCHKKQLIHKHSVKILIRRYSQIWFKGLVVRVKVSKIGEIKRNKRKTRNQNRICRSGVFSVLNEKLVQRFKEVQC